MRDARGRLAGLKRIETVQAQMVRLSEARLAAATLEARNLAADAARLRDYLAGDGQEGVPLVIPLGAPLVKAALKTSLAIERRFAAAERDRLAQTERLRELRARARAVERMGAEAAAAARRVDEDRALAQAMEAWLAREG